MLSRKIQQTGAISEDRIEYEYEYRDAEYEYDTSPEYRRTMPQTNAAEWTLF